MPDYAVPVARADQWRLVERRLEEAGITGFRRAVVCKIFEEENCRAALGYIADLEEVSDGTE